MENRLYTLVEAEKDIKYCENREWKKMTESKYILPISCKDSIPAIYVDEGLYKV